MRAIAMTIALVLLAGAVVLWLRSRSQPVVDGDLQVIHQLAAAGSDLSKPHPIEFFIYFPTEDAARSAAEQLAESAFATTVDRGADGDSWLCLATKSMVPAHDTLLEIRAHFEEVAAGLGGEYDGWGTPVVE